MKNSTTLKLKLEHYNSHDIGWTCFKGRSSKPESLMEGWILLDDSLNFSASEVIQVNVERCKLP